MLHDGASVFASVMCATTAPGSFRLFAARKSASIRALSDASPTVALPVTAAAPELAFGVVVIVCGVAASSV